MSSRHQNTDLPLKIRRNTKSSKVKKHKKNLGKSIEERSDSIDFHKKFGHWEIDTVIGQKSGNDCVLLTIVERHNGLIRRFIPKGKRMSNYNPDDIAFIEDRMNTLPRRILNYKTPEELFELQLDIIYAV